MRTIENFKKENELTNEMMEELKDCYESPYNEHADLSFVDWLYAIKEAEGGTIFAEILEDFVEF